MAKAKYEIIHSGKKDQLSVVFADESSRGVALSSSTVGADGEITAILAQPDNPDFLGHLTRNVTETGLPTAEDLLFRDGGGDAQRLEDPDKAGGRVTVEDVEVFEAEGDMLFDGDDAITSGTALHTLITLEDGLPRVAQAGEYAFYSLIGKPDPVDPDNNDFRCQFKRINTVKVAA